MWSTEPGPDKGKIYSNVLVVTCRICSTHFPLLLLLLLVCRRLLSTPGGHLCRQTLSHVIPTKEPTALYIPPLINAIKYSSLESLNICNKTVRRITADCRAANACSFQKVIGQHDTVTTSQWALTRNTGMLLNCIYLHSYSPSSSAELGHSRAKWPGRSQR